MNSTPEQFKIAEADGLEVISLVDNSADFLSLPLTDKRLNLLDNGLESGMVKNGQEPIPNCPLPNMVSQ
jgi:hypothetical protein